MSAIISTTDFPSDFIIRVRGQEFYLSESELLTEPGNALLAPLATTPSLSGPWQLPTVHVNSDPNLFKLVYAHLRGFEILPLPERGTPIGITNEPITMTYLSREATLINLLTLANELGLRRLEGRVHREIATRLETKLETRFETNSGDIKPRQEIEAPISGMSRQMRYRLVINSGRWAPWNQQTILGTAISQATKESILLKLINSNVELVRTSLPIPDSYRVLAAWDEYPHTGGFEINTKTFVLLESI